MRDNRIETINKETLGFAITMMGVGIWLSSWFVVILIYAFGLDGPAGLLVIGSGIMLGGMGIYFTGREERIKRY